MGQSRQELDGLVANAERALAELKAAVARVPEKRLVRIHAILDRSASMESLEQATIDGFNKFIDEQRADTSTDVQVSLTLFAGPYERSTLYVNRPIAQVRPLTREEYRADGSSTALNQAVYDTLRPYERGDDERVANVVLVITDGQENRSVITKEQVVALLKRLDARPNWNVVYLGADASTWDEARSYGVYAGNTAQWTHSTTGVNAAYVSLSSATLKFRDGLRSRGVTKTVNYLAPDDSVTLTTTAQSIEGGPPATTTAASATPEEL